MKNFSNKLVLAFSLFLCMGLCLALPKLGLAQGYNGLIPDDAPAASSDTGSKTNDGYSGVMAPSPERPTHTRQQEPQGYSGVIPGYTPPESSGGHPSTAQGSSPQNTGTIEYSPAKSRPVVRGNDPGYTPNHHKPQVTYRPGFKERPPVLSVNDLKTLATLLKHGIDFSKLPASFEKSIHLPPGTFRVLSRPQSTIDGMLPTEYAMKRMIDTTMTMVNNPILSPDERHKQAEAAIDRLNRMAMGLRVTVNIPQSIYDKMGAPDIYVEQAREGGTKALKRLDEAIYTLSKM